MKTKAILEIEEGWLTLTVADVGCKPMRIRSCLQQKMPEIGRETVANVLQAFAAQTLEGVAGLHVIVGDRRALHVTTTVPPMAADDAVRFLAREVARAGGLQGPDEALMTARLLRVLPEGRLHLGASALPRAAWNPIAAAVEDCGIQVHGLYTMESCLALAAEPSAQGVAVLECSAGRARFVACDGDAPALVRRFLVGGGEGSSSAIVGQLAMELPRTLDWVRENGLQTPKAILYGNRMQIDEDGLTMLRGDLERFEAATLVAHFDDGVAVPGLATLSLLRRLAQAAAPVSLLDEPWLQVPWSRRAVTAFAALAVLGLGMSWFGWQQGREYLGFRDDQRNVDLLVRDVETHIAEAMPAAPGGETAPGTSQLDNALRSRRPVSRLVAEVSNAANDMLHLDALQFAGNERITVTGVVKAANRNAALAALTAFTSRLRGLPYVVADGQDEVAEVGGSGHCLRFKIAMAWRNS